MDLQISTLPIDRRAAQFIDPQNDSHGYSQKTLLRRIFRFKQNGEKPESESKDIG